MDCTLWARDESFYVGETRRSVRLRYNEHIIDAKNKKTDTPFGLHQTKDPDQWLNSTNVSIQILHVSKDNPDQKMGINLHLRLKPAHGRGRLSAPPPQVFRR